MKQTIRKAETSKAKAEARLECLKAGGVNVDEWLKEAETLNVQEIQRSTSSLSVRTDASGVGGVSFSFGKLIFICILCLLINLVCFRTIRVQIHFMIVILLMRKLLLLVVLRKWKRKRWRW